MKAGVLIFPKVEELDFIGPWEMVGMWSMYAEGLEQRLIAAQTLDLVLCAKGLKVKPDVSIKQCPQLDVTSSREIAR